MPGKFIGHLGLDYIDGFLWGIQEPLRFDIGELGSDKFVVVPAHYVTDFNSIPRGLWNIFPPTQYGKSSIVHDYLCDGGEITWQTVSITVHVKPDFGEIDAIYKESLKIEGCSWFKRNAMWMGVRANHLTRPLQFWRK